jgi:hypothetical protein
MPYDINIIGKIAKIKDHIGSKPPKRFSVLAFLNDWIIALKKNMKNKT